MNRNSQVNPYLQLSRFVGKELDFKTVEYFVSKYIDDAIQNGQSSTEASNDLKEFFVQLSDAIFQATVNYGDQFQTYNDNASDAVIIEERSENKLLTVEEVATELGVTSQMVRNYIKQNKIPAIKLSARKTKIRQSSLDDFIKSNS